MAKDVNSELTNLMDLLDEQDVSLYAKISNTILLYGLPAIPFLEEISEKSMNETVQSRVRSLLKKIRIQNLFGELHNWATLEAHDLLKGYFIVSKYQFPGLEEDVVMAKVEALKKEVWLELKKGMTPFEELSVISKIFFEVRKFSFNINSSAIPDSFCLNVILNSGKGHPDVFVILYAGIAQRLGIPVYGSYLPEKIFLTYVNSGVQTEPDLKQDVKFYLNPMCAGAFFSNSAMMNRIESDFPDEIERYTGACTNTMVIYQLLDEFRSHFLLKKHPDKAEDISVLMTALNVD